MSSRCDLNSIVLVLILVATFQLSSGQQQSVMDCQNQCMQSYRQLFQYYCRYQGISCVYYGYVSQFYHACFNACGGTPTTTRAPVPTQDSTQPQQPTECGTSLVGRIVGGTTAEECEFPWAVVVNSGNLFCGGNILDSNTILTAGHCVYSSATGLTNANQISVKYGSSDQQRMETAYVTRVDLNPNFILQYYDYDVAILTLDRNLVFNDCVRPICLPEPNADPMATSGCQAAGWGALNFQVQQAQRNLRKVSLPIVPLNQCAVRYGSRLITNIKVCAGNLQNGNIDSCVGDSGGPLMCYSGGAYQLFGVVSFGRGCGVAGYPGVYANVANPAINSWIRSKM